MLVLLQLLKLFKDGESREGLLSWCDSIHDDPSEGKAFQDYLANCCWVDLNSRQIDTLIRVCQNNSYISAFKI